LKSIGYINKKEQINRNNHLDTQIISLIKQQVNIEKLGVTIVIFISYFLVRQYLQKKLIKSDDHDYESKVEQKKKLIGAVRIIVFTSIFLIWFTEVQSFFISILAVAAALVVATKELIMCTTGGILLKFGHSFKLKDRIEIDNIRGYVIEKGITFTKVLEIGPEKESQQTTGSIIVIPNSIFLSKSVKNESYFKGYSIKSFSFHLPEHISIDEAEEFLISKARKITEPYRNKAKNAIGDYCKKEGLALPSIESRVKVNYTSNGKVSMLLKMPIVNKKIADVEQELVRDYIRFIKEKA